MNSVTQGVIKHKVGLLNLASELGNVSRACKVMGFSRDTFYRYKSAVEDGGVEALIEANRKKPNLKNRVDQATEEAVVAFSLEQPAFGQVRVSNELRKRGTFISPSGVRSIWLRHDQQSFKQRLSALERHIAETGAVLTENQVQALERKQDDDVTHGEIETAHPGYLGSQDTFYVGTIKGVGRIYQQTFVDTYSKWAAAKLYTTKTPITAADLLNDRVLPFMAEQGMGMLRVLTDRGTEYCGKPESHDYQLYLALNDIEHTRTKVRHPQTNGICERFHKTILQEFYQVAFRRKIYRSIDEIQVDLDAWVDHYNGERTHQGKMCCGRTPLQTLIEGKEAWDQKVTVMNNVI
ncbi:integrase [Achromobacter piechaudii]|uniref:IS481 family transposase n=1 Tax=Achromobacter piechaudii TaxID=72556 RepID=UPI000682988B|nr:IS481 family transposase [Achromobacter piechaudii]KNY08686.1 integrase [Achromobacter piechaudii]CAB3925254.1 IS481 family transposase IS1419 [Achromobacter piechaudii]CAB3955734.1 IS481 family transposase IS1419 [Achromobacter piechaudii]CAB3955838.1 IS481 family transposase IS1419 [Achromobacter piechaudii]